MRELWCDFDGVIVCNKMRNINTSEITSEEFAALVTEAYSKKPIVSLMARRLVAEIRVVDDDKGLLLHPKENLQHENLLLTHYEFFADRSEVMTHL